MNLFFYVYISVYMLIHWLGGGDGLNASFLDYFRELPFIVFSTAFVIIAVFRYGKSRKYTELMLLTLFCAGLWMSFLTGYYGEFVVTEGQFVDLKEAGPLEWGHYSGLYAPKPSLEFRLEKATVVFSEDGNSVNKIKGVLRVFNNNGIKQLSIADRYNFYHGYLIRTADFGYSPRYELKNREGRLLDSSFVYLRLFPPGTQDYFRLLSPLTYYLRYYPDRETFQLKITRNKDIILFKTVRAGEEAGFENALISLPEVRKWITVRVLNDWGMIVSLFSLLSMIALQVIFIITSAWLRLFQILK